MCLASKEIQTTGRLHVSFTIPYEYVGRRYFIDGHVVTIIHVTPPKINYTCNGSNYRLSRPTWHKRNPKWIPSQDDLQGMIDRTAQVTLDKLEDSFPPIKKIMVAWRKKYLLGKTDWREVWLRLYMHINHNKTWDGKCWK